MATNMASWVHERATKVSVYIATHGIPSADAIEILYPRLSMEGRMRIMKLLPALISRARVQDLVDSLKSLNKNKGEV